MKRSKLFFLLTIFVLVFSLGCNSVESELFSDADKLISRSGGDMPGDKILTLSQQEAFKIGSNYLSFENGKYKFKLTRSNAIKLGISDRDYDIMNGDVDAANLIVYEVRNKAEIDDSYFELVNSDTIICKEVDVELDSIVLFSDTQRVIRKSYGEGVGGNIPYYYRDFTLYVPYGGPYNYYIGFSSTGWFNTYVGGLVNGYTNFGFTSYGNHCYFNISVPGPGVYTIRVLISGYGDIRMTQLPYNIY